MSSGKLSLISDVLGIIGGILVGFCLIPEIVLIIRKRTGEGVSYLWLCTFLVGNVSYLFHLVEQGDVIAWVAVVLETACTLLTLTLKVYFSYHNEALAGTKGDTTTTGSASSSPTHDASRKAIAKHSKAASQKTLGEGTSTSSFDDFSDSESYV